MEYRYHNSVIGNDSGRLDCFSNATCGMIFLSTIDFVSDNEVVRIPKLMRHNVFLKSVEVEKRRVMKSVKNAEMYFLHLMSEK